MALSLLPGQRSLFILHSPLRWFSKDILGTVVLENTLQRRKGRKGARRPLGLGNKEHLSTMVD